MYTVKTKSAIEEFKNIESLSQQVLLNTIAVEWDFYQLIENMPAVDRAAVLQIYKDQIKRELKV